MKESQIIVLLQKLKLNQVASSVQPSQCAIALDMLPFEYTTFPIQFTMVPHVLNVNEAFAARRTATSRSLA